MHCIVPLDSVECRTARRNWSRLYDPLLNRAIQDFILLSCWTSFVVDGCLNHCEDERRHSGLALSTLAIWCRIVRFRDVHPCYMVPYCPVPRCPPLLYGAALSGSAMSSSAFSAPPTVLVLFLCWLPKACSQYGLLVCLSHNFTSVECWNMWWLFSYLRIRIANNKYAACLSVIGGSVLVHISAATEDRLLSTVFLLNLLILQHHHFILIL